jgi:protein TonB
MKLPSSFITLLPEELTRPDASIAKMKEAVPVPSSAVPRFGAPPHLVPDRFWSNLVQFLTERPVKVIERKDAPFTQTSFGAGIGDNLKDFFSSRPVPKSTGKSRLEVNWGAGFGGFGDRLKELFFPSKLAPLPFAVKPVKVKEIWSKDENFGWTQIISFGLHGGLLALLIVPIFTNMLPATTEAKNKMDVTPLDISQYVGKLPAGNNKAGGGGGGGERSPIPPTKGRAPKFAMTQFTPPSATIKNLNPKLAMDPTLLGPPELKIANPALSNFGDPLAASVNMSGGPGGGSGIGIGEGGGIGSGSGAGLGPGEGGGTGGGAFRAGINGVGMPTCYYHPDPQYSEEARKAKYGGTVMVQVLITLDGRVINPTVIKSPGLGLDEKAIEAVRTWRCKPALGPSGKPVPTLVPIEVTFRLY